MTSTRKTCLVTGCSGGGVGAAIAEAFRDGGYHVFATARSPSKIPESLSSAPNVTVLALDVGSSESIAAVVLAVTEQTGGKLDVLVNNAGLGLNMPGLDTSIAEAKKLFDINFFGAIEMMQAFSHLLIKAQGCIVNNSSIGGSAALPFLSMYQASKAALTQASEVMRLELTPLGVRVLVLLAGGIQTNFLNNQPNPPLPKGSYYSSVKDIIDDQPEKIPFGVSPESFAKDVVRQVNRGTTGKYWIGGGANLVRVMLWLLPQCILDYSSYYLKPFVPKLKGSRKAA